MSASVRAFYAAKLKIRLNFCFWAKKNLETILFPFTGTQPVTPLRGSGAIRSRIPFAVLCRERNDFAQRREQLRLLLVRLHGAVHCADVPVNDADRLAGIAGVFCFPFTDLNALNKQPQQFRCQRINCCVLLCLFNESIHVRFARLKLCQTLFFLRNLFLQHTLLVRVIAGEHPVLLVGHVLRCFSG